VANLDTDLPGQQHLLPLGTRIAEFEVKGVVGEGGFGTVYLAFDHSLLRTVALKEYLPTALAQRSGTSQVVVRSERNRETFEAGMKSFINEARLLAQFDHPALVKVYRFWEANNTAYLVMPYYEGVNFRQLIRDEPERIDEHYLRDMLAPLLDALEYLHQAQIFHRDIAPDNIMILQNGQPVLLDFGAARRVISDMTQALTVILKPGFAPIEQYADDPSMKQGSWTDIYALSAVLYYALLRKAPPAAVTRMIKDNLQPLVKDESLMHYDRDFLAAIDGGLAVVPENRIQTIADFRSQLGMRTYIRPRSSGAASASGSPGADSGVPRTGARTGIQVPRTMPIVTGIGAAAKAPNPSSAALAVTPVVPAAETIPRTLPQTAVKTIAKTVAKTQAYLPDLNPDTNFARFAQNEQASARADAAKSAMADDPDQTTVMFNPALISNDQAASAKQGNADPLATVVLTPEAMRQIMLDQSAEGKSPPGGALEADPIAVRIVPSAKTAMPLPVAEAIAPKAPAIDREKASAPAAPEIVRPIAELPAAKNAKTPPSAVASKPLPPGKVSPAKKKPTGLIALGAIAAAIVAVALLVLTRNTPPAAPPIAMAPAPAPAAPTAAPSAPASGTPSTASPSAPVAAPLPAPTPPAEPVDPEQAAWEALQRPFKQAEVESFLKQFPGGKHTAEAKKAIDEAIRQSTGRLILVVKPWGNVSVNGAPQGSSPPLKNLNLAEGKYEVKIENEGFAPYTVQLDIKNGQSRRIEHTFR
jgi:serine/threonine protein kinase